MNLSRTRKIIAVSVIASFGLIIYTEIPSVDIIKMVVTWLVTGPAAVIVLTRKAEPEKQMPVDPHPPTRPRTESSKEEYLAALVKQLIIGGGVDVEATAEGEHTLKVGGLNITLRGTGQKVILPKLKQIEPTEDDTSALSTDSIPVDA